MIDPALTDTKYVVARSTPVGFRLNEIKSSFGFEGVPLLLQVTEESPAPAMEQFDPPQPSREFVRQGDVGTSCETQSPEESPLPSYSRDAHPVHEGTKSPPDQIPAACATDDLVCPVEPHST
jgi:hypothetical protein